MAIRTCTYDKRITMIQPYAGQSTQRFWRYRETITFKHQGLYRGMVIMDACERTVELYRVFYKLMGKEMCHVLHSTIHDDTPFSETFDNRDEKTYTIEFVFAHQVKPNGQDRVIEDLDAP